MANRIETGVHGLDAILGGGFLRHNSILLKGAPGAGKTSLGIQVLVHGLLEQDEPGIVCSFEQFPQQLQRDTAAFGWDLAELESEARLRVAYLRPDELIAPAGSTHPALHSRVIEMAEDIGAKRLLLDSLSHFNRVTNDPTQCRTVMLEFINAVKAAGITPILTAELDARGSREYSFEEYLVDTVVLLHSESRTGERPTRAVEIAKSRGHAHAPGRHPFRIDTDGIRVFPRILPEAYASDEAPVGDEAAAAGVAGLDNLLGGGYPRGRASIVAGMSGCFKSSLAGAFLKQGADQDEPGLLITFQEMPARLVRSLDDRGIGIGEAVASGRVAVRHYVAGRNPLEEVFFDLERDLAKDDAPKRVVLESLDEFQRAAESPEAAKETLNMFLARLARAGATTLLTQRLTTAPGADPLAGIPYADMVDTVVYLGNVEIESELHKVVSVPKSRSAHAETALREIVCRADGLHVSQKFHGLSGILQGVAHGRYKKTVENVFQPLYFIRDFAAMGAGDDASDEQRRRILNDIARQTDTLDGALKDHFGFDPEKAGKE